MYSGALEVGISVQRFQTEVRRQERLHGGGKCRRGRNDERRKEGGDQKRKQRSPVVFMGVVFGGGSLWRVFMGVIFVGDLYGVGLYEMMSWGCYGGLS